VGLALTAVTAGTLPTVWDCCPLAGLAVHSGGPGSVPGRARSAHTTLGINPVAGFCLGGSIAAATVTPMSRSGRLSRTGFIESSAGEVWTGQSGLHHLNSAASRKQGND